MNARVSELGTIVSRNMRRVGGNHVLAKLHCALEEFKDAMIARNQVKSTMA